MDIKGVREALHKQPFQPFVMRLADGRSLPVQHPDFLAVGKRRLVLIDEDDGWSFIEPLMIVSIDQIKKTPPGGNGKKRR
jgi:hypothetical protein